MSLSVPFGAVHSLSCESCVLILTTQRDKGLLNRPRDPPCVQKANIIINASYSQMLQKTNTGAAVTKHVLALYVISTPGTSPSVVSAWLDLMIYVSTLRENLLVLASVWSHRRVDMFFPLIFQAIDH